MNFLLEGPGGLPGAKQAGSIATNLPVTINGNLTVTGVLTSGSEVQGAGVFTSNSANALAVGPNGSTNPVFVVDASAGSAAAGVRVVGVSAGSGVVLTVASSNAAEDLVIQPKGTGSIKLGRDNGNNVWMYQLTQVGKANAAAFSVGPSITGTGSGATLVVDTSTASVATGLSIKGAATGGTTALTAIDTGSNTNLSIAAKGTGVITFQPAVAVAAGGNAQSSILMSSTAALGVYFGSGAPTVSAAQGSLYIRTDGSSTSTRLYVNTNGSTGWTNVTTAT